MHGDNHYSGLLVRCDGCDAPFTEDELGYCTECSYDLCEDCLVGGRSLDGHHNEACLNPEEDDEDDEESEEGLDKE